MYGDPAAIPALEQTLARIPADDPRSRAPIQAVIESLAAGAMASPEPDKPFDIWALYPAEAAPDFGALEDEDRLAMLEKGSAKPTSRRGAQLPGHGPVRSSARAIDPARQRPIRMPLCGGLVGRRSARSAMSPNCGRRCSSPGRSEGGHRRKIRRWPSAWRSNRDNAAVYQAILKLVSGPARPRQGAQGHGTIVRQAFCRLSAQAPR